uniref:Uncharacterized protein n=1 Tax=Oryza punctata TaxID=4537 RepID=A0A0E0MFL8_ORYPU
MGGTSSWRQQQPKGGEGDKVMFQGSSGSWEMARGPAGGGEHRSSPLFTGEDKLLARGRGCWGRAQRGAAIGNGGTSWQHTAWRGGAAGGGRRWRCHWLPMRTSFQWYVRGRGGRCDDKGGGC